MSTTKRKAGKSGPIANAVMKSIRCELQSVWYVLTDTPVVLKMRQGHARFADEAVALRGKARA